MKKEMSAIGRAIFLSKVILEAKIYKVQLNRTRVMNQTIHLTLTDKDVFDKLSSKLESRKMELHQAVKRLLTPFFGGRDFDYTDIRHWYLSKDDMTRGYVDLYEIADRDNDGNPIGPTFRHVLFLSDYSYTRKDVNQEISISEGDLLPFNKVSSILGNQKNVYGEESKIHNMLLSYPTIPSIKIRTYDSK